MTLRIQELYETHRLNGLGLNSAENESAVLSELYAHHVTVDAELQATMGRIQHDSRLTEEGKKKSRMETSLAAHKKLWDWLGPRVANLEKAIEQRLGELRAAANPPTTLDTAARIEAAMLRAEVRRQVASMPPEAVEEVYRRGGPIARAALEELPNIQTSEQGFAKIRPFVSPELREQVTIEAGALLAPKVAAELADLRTIRDVLTRCANVLERSLEADAPGLAAALAPSPTVL